MQRKLRQPWRSRSSFSPLKRSPFATLFKTWVFVFKGIPKCGRYPSSLNQNHSSNVGSGPGSAFCEKRESAYSLRHPPLSRQLPPSLLRKMDCRVLSAGSGTLKRRQCSEREQQTVPGHRQARWNLNKRFEGPPGAFNSFTPLFTALGGLRSKT